MPFKSFELKLPRTQVGSVLFASPHSGREMPADFLDQTILSETQIRSSEDAFVDDLYDAAPQLGAPLLHALAPRAFVDLNRAPDELDPALIEGLRRQSPNPRVASGLGVIPRVVANGRHIYSGKITLESAYGRIQNYWRPYHDRLRALIDVTRQQFGEAILIDCHSMPHEALDAMMIGHGERPDIVLGDRFGASSDGAISDRVAAAFKRQGFRVSRNIPFAGAYIAQNYGRPSIGQHVVQIEINRALYMDEARLEKSAGFEGVRERLVGAMCDIIDIGRAQMPLAAE